MTPPSRSYNTHPVKTTVSATAARRLRPFLPILAALLVAGGCATLHESARTGDLKTVRFLLESGAAPDEPDSAGTTPLMVASRRGDGRMVNLLLDRGADIDRRNRAGQSALSLAWEHGRELTFRLLLDRGAAIHFDADVGRLPADDRRRGLWRMAEEERLFRPIAEAGARTPPERFDAYFERFPDGRRREAVLEYLAEAARERLAALGDAPDAGTAAAVVRDFGAIGHRRFIVAASRLNIRAEAAASARIVGQYGRGDAVLARAARPGWIRTDRGWISRDHVRPGGNDVPELRELLRTASEKRASSPAKPTASVGDRRPKAGGPAADSVRPAKGSPTVADAVSREARSDPSLAASPADLRRAAHQFDTLMKTPTLKGLEAFVLAYKDREPYADLVRRARTAYRDLLLREVAP